MFYNSCKEGSYSCQAWPGEVTLHPGAWAELVRRERGRVNWMHYITRSVEIFQVTQDVNCVMVCIKIPFNQIQPGREDVQLQLPVHQHEVQAAEQDPTQDGRPQPGPWADARLRWCHDYHIITAQLNDLVTRSAAWPWQGWQPLVHPLRPGDQWPLPDVKIFKQWKETQSWNSFLLYTSEVALRKLNNS